MEGKKHLIYKEDLLELFTVQAPSMSYDKMFMAVANAPTVDAVEVVRCKDCKHWQEETEWCDKHSHFVDRVGDFCYPEESGDWKMFDADYFCKDGERKDNERKAD